MARRHPQTAVGPSPATSPQSPGSVLPRHYSPMVAGYARGPFIEPVTVTPTDWRWRNARSAIVRDRNGTDWRCIRVVSEGVIVGWWAVELLGIPLSAFQEGGNDGPR